MIKAIRRKFRIPRKTDNYPISAKRGGRVALAELIGECGLNKCAEIGVKKGDYSRLLCEKNPNIELYCIDSWFEPRYQIKMEEYRSKAIKNLATFNVKIIRKTSMEALTDFEDKSLDFVHIDANHHFDFVCPDIIFWSLKVRSGGIVACHDYFHHHFGGVIRAVDAYVLSHNIQPYFVTLELWPTVFWVNP